MSKQVSIGVYSDRHRGVPVSILEGFKALGFRALHRGSNAYKRGEVEDFAVIVLTGLHGNSKEILEDYEAKGIPVLIYDLARVRSPDFNHIYLGFGGLNWMPKVAVDDKRLKKIEFNGVKDHKGGNKIVILGQMPNDQAHSFSLKGLDEIYNKAIAEISKNSEKDIIFRPHPLNNHKHDIKGAEIRTNEQEDLFEALEDAHAVVTLNSTSAITALRLGIPVFAMDNSFLSSVSVDIDTLGIIDDLDAELLDKEVVEEFFQKLSYSQWSIKEVASGEALEFLMGDIDLEIPEVVAKTLPEVNVEEAEKAAEAIKKENKEPEEQDDQSDAVDSGATENSSEGSDVVEGSDDASTGDATAMGSAEDGSGDGSDAQEAPEAELPTGVVVNVKKPKKKAAKKKTPAKKKAKK